jgi:hypothetical protein
MAYGRGAHCVHAHDTAPRRAARLADGMPECPADLPVAAAA